MQDLDLCPFLYAYCNLNIASLLTNIDNSNIFLNRRIWKWMRVYFGSSTSLLKQYETSSFTHRLSLCCLHCWLLVDCCIFFVFWVKVSLNEIWRYHFLFYKMRRFTFQKILGLHIHFWIYNITEHNFDALIRRSVNLISK